MDDEHFDVIVEGEAWPVSSGTEAVQTVAGALLAGADSIRIERKGAVGQGKAAFLGRTDKGHGNEYEFLMPDGRVVALGPNATVSELQNRV